MIHPYPLRCKGLRIISLGYPQAKQNKFLVNRSEAFNMHPTQTNTFTQGNKHMKLLTIKEVMNLLNIKRTTVFEWTKSGYLPAPVRRPSGHTLGYKLADIENWMDANKG